MLLLFLNYVIPKFFYETYISILYKKYLPFVIDKKEGRPMKQVQPKIKKTIMMLLVLFLTVTIISAKENLFNKKSNNDKGSKLENALLQKLQKIPTFAKYFQSPKNPGLTGFLKIQSDTPKIDSMVSMAYNTSYQKIKNTYQYNANGYISNFIKMSYNNDSLVSGYSCNLDIRPDGKPISLLHMQYQDGVWTNRFKNTYTYDPSGNQTSYAFQYWDTTLTTWVNFYKYEYTYDAKHNMLTWSFTEWDTSSSDWRNMYKSEYTYDVNNNMLSDASYEWNSSSNDWEKSYKLEYTYDANNNKILQLNFGLNGSTWVQEFKTEFTYDGNNNLISENEYEWKSSTSTWENYSWILYTYTNNKLTFQNEKKWDESSSSWVNKNRTNSTYNSNGKYLSIFKDSYYSGAWHKTSEYLFEYDNNDHIISYIKRSLWDGNSWHNNDKFNFRYNSMGLCNGGNHETWFSGHWVSADAPWMMFLPEYFDYEYYGKTETLLEQQIRWFNSIKGYEYSVYYNGITDVKEKVATPSKYTLEQNYPNPFNPSTKISYSLPKATHVSLKVYDVLGNEITTLVNKNQSAGNYKVNFDASNLTSGVYFYKISTNNFSQVRKMMLIK